MIFFAVELLNGHIYIHLDLGSGAVKVRASRRRVDDGIWHEMSLRRVGREGKVSIDGQWNEFKTPGEATTLELDSPLYVGGIGPAYLDIAGPPALWTATLRQGFVGCLRDLILNGKPVDIAAFARQQDSGKSRCSLQLLMTNSFESNTLFVARIYPTIMPRGIKSMWWRNTALSKWRRLY